MGALIDCHLLGRPKIELVRWFNLRGLDRHILTLHRFGQWDLDRFQNIDGGRQLHLPRQPALLQKQRLFMWWNWFAQHEIWRSFWCKPIDYIPSGNHTILLSLRLEEWHLRCFGFSWRRFGKQHCHFGWSFHSLLCYLFQPLVVSHLCCPKQGCYYHIL